MENQENFLRESIKVANDAVQHGNHPFGAILVLDGRIILSAENSVITDKDVTCHAETNLVSLASKQFSRKELKKSTLYASTEPCPMCATAIYWSGIGRIVFGCPETGLAKYAGQHFNLTIRDLFKNCSIPPEIIGPILQDEAEQIHRAYWKR